MPRQPETKAFVADDPPTVQEVASAVRHVLISCRSQDARFQQDLRDNRGFEHEQHGEVWTFLRGLKDVARVDCNSS